MAGEAASAGREDLKSTAYEFFILAVSVLSIVNMALLAIFDFEGQNWWLVAYVDAMLTIIFVIDFSYRLRTAPSKWVYLRHNGGVFDLLACFPGFRIFRLFRIYRAVRVTRRLGGPRVLRELRSQLASGVLYFVVLLGILTLEFIGLAELHFEQHAPNGNITTGGDALWWGYVTATTVGYGDKYPTTPGGRIVGTMMLTIGVALFATFSGFLANAFLSHKAEKPEPERTDAGDALRELERLLDEQQQMTAVLRSRLAELESR
jgi:voltage-gated potassium channel